MTSFTVVGGDVLDAPRYKQFNQPPRRENEIPASVGRGLAPAAECNRKFNVSRRHQGIALRYFIFIPPNIPSRCIETFKPPIHIAKGEGCLSIRVANISHLRSKYFIAKRFHSTKSDFTADEVRYGGFLWLISAILCRN